MPSNEEARGCLPQAVDDMAVGRQAESQLELRRRKAQLASTMQMLPPMNAHDDAVLRRMLTPPAVADVLQPWQVQGRQQRKSENKPQTNSGETDKSTKQDHCRQCPSRQRQAQSHMAHHTAEHKQQGQRGEELADPTPAARTPVLATVTAAPQGQETVPDNKHLKLTGTGHTPMQQDVPMDRATTDEMLNDTFGDRIAWFRECPAVVQVPPCPQEQPEPMRKKQDAPARVSSAERSWNLVAAGVPAPNETTEAIAGHRGKTAKMSMGDTPSCDTSYTLTDTTGAKPGETQCCDPSTSHAPPQMDTGCEDRLRIMTLNCRGLLCNTVAVGLTVEEHSPNILFLTETKLVSNKNRPPAVKDILLDYEWSTSSATKKEARKPYKDRPNAGVIVAVHMMLSAGGRIVQIEPSSDLAGNLCPTGMRLQDNTVLHIIGVYLPENITIRTHIFEYLTEIAKLCRTAGHAMLVGGDWNAVLCPSDRCTATMDTADRTYAEFAQVAGLQPLCTYDDTARLPTYTQTTGGHTTHRSRIDDVLTLDTMALTLAGPGSVQESTPETGGNLDHLPLIHDVCHSALRLTHSQVRTQPAAKHEAKIMLPILKAHLDKAQMEIAAIHGAAAACINTRIGQVTSVMLEKLGLDHTAPSIKRLRQSTTEDTQALVDELAAGFQTVLEGSLTTMRQECASKPAGTGNVYMKRSATRQHRLLFKQHKELRCLLRATREARLRGELTEYQEIIMAEAERHEWGEHIITHLVTMPVNKTDAQSWDDWQEEVNRAATVTAEGFRAITNQSRSESLDKARKKFQHKLSTNPKAANREMFNPGEGAPRGPYAIRHPETGKVEHSQTCLTLHTPTTHAS